MTCSYKAELTEGIFDTFKDILRYVVSSKIKHNLLNSINFDWSDIVRLIDVEQVSFAAFGTFDLIFNQFLYNINS